MHLLLHGCGMWHFAELEHCFQHIACSMIWIQCFHVAANVRVEHSVWMSSTVALAVAQHIQRFFRRKSFDSQAQHFAAYQIEELLLIQCCWILLNQFVHYSIAELQLKRPSLITFSLMTMQSLQFSCTIFQQQKAKCYNSGVENTQIIQANCKPTWCAELKIPTRCIVILNLKELSFQRWASMKCSNRSQTLKRSIHMR